MICGGTGNNERKIPTIISCKFEPNIPLLDVMEIDVRPPQYMLGVRRMVDQNVLVVGMIDTVLLVDINSKGKMVTRRKIDIGGTGRKVIISAPVVDFLIQRDTIYCIRYKINTITIINLKQQ